MATRLKTIEYWFPLIDTLADNTATPATQITVYIPEAATGTINFHSVVADVHVHDCNTTLANVTSRITTLTLQGATASTVTNATTLTQSGENFNHQFSANFTSYFTANWGANASRTLDCSITINTGTLGSRSASIRVVISYDFDDTQSTHIKTVWIPLNADVNAAATTKPGTPIDTIPALDTYCPEASKTFRQLVIVSQGNTESGTATDISRSWEIDSNGPFTSQLFEKGTTVDMWYRLNEVVTFTTNSTHSFYTWASATDFDHPQNWLVVTYEFSPGSTTSILNSLILPMEFGGTMGGTTSADYQRASRELWIEESNVTSQRIAVFIHYDKLAAIAGLNARVGTGSFVAYTCVASVLSGGAGLMIRNDSAFTLARGRNTLTADIYNTDTVDLGNNLAAWWIVNYTSDVPTSGIWSANHTVIRNLKSVDTQAAASQSIVAAVAPDIPETTWFLNAIGIHYIYTSNGTGNAAGVHIGAERLVSGEGGQAWENIYEALGGTDPEVGIRQAWAQARTVFRRFRDGSMTDADSNRLPFETARRWRVCLGGSCASFDHLDMYFTYHSITYAVSGTISGSAGGSVTINLHRSGNGEKLMSKTQTGNGAFSFTWFDNTENVFVDVYEDATHMGRSDDSVAV